MNSKRAYLERMKVRLESELKEVCDKIAQLPPIDVPDMPALLLSQHITNLHCSKAVYTGSLTFMLDLPRLSAFAHEKYPWYTFDGDAGSLYILRMKTGHFKFTCLQMKTVEEAENCLLEHLPMLLKYKV